MNLREETYKLTRQIPRGRVSTYGAIAEALGDLIAARAVGMVLNQNPNLIEMPCHRVVHSNGDVGGYRWGVGQKVRLLRSEGVNVKKGKVADFRVFKEFDTSYPLKTLKEQQRELARKVKLKELKEPRVVAAADISYSKKDPFKAYGGIILMDYKTKEILEKKVLEREVTFPYIPTYLSFREFPVIRELVRKLERGFDVLILDGNGILHPLGVGLASHTGVLLKIPTIGVAKKLLCGNEVDGKILLNRKRVGFALRISGKNPIYVSPGHLISLKNSLRIVKGFCKYKIPEPLRQAHILARPSTR